MKTKFRTLFSGSSGNSYFLKMNDVNILVDVGKSAKKIKEQLERIDEDIERIDFMILTHEHIDHSAGLKILMKKYNMNLIINENMLEAVKDRLENVEEDRIITYITNDEIKFKDISIKSFEVSHDAADPNGFSFNNGKHKVTISTDLGFVTENIIDHYAGSHIALVESNHEVEILAVSRYPYHLKRRILSDYGHLSNDQARPILEKLKETNCKHIVLGHLSLENNTEAIAYRAARNVIEDENITIEVAKREEPGVLYELD